MGQRCVSLSTTRVEKNFHANVTLFLAPKQLSQFEIPSRIFFSYALFFPLFNISRGRELFASFKKKILASKVPSLLRDLHFFLRYSIIPDFYSNRSRVHFVDSKHVRLDEDRIRLKEEREDKERRIVVSSYLLTRREKGRNWPEFVDSFRGTLETHPGSVYFSTKEEGRNGVFRFPRISPPLYRRANERERENLTRDA